MTEDAEKFLEAVLFTVDEEKIEKYKDYSIHDFSPPFVKGVEFFIEGFETFLEEHNFDLNRLKHLERSFGSNCYFSLSGHGVGFFDDYNKEDRDLGDDLQRMLEDYSQNDYRFEDLNLDDESGIIDIGILPDSIDKFRTELFDVSVKP